MKASSETEPQSAPESESPRALSDADVREFFRECAALVERKLDQLVPAEEQEPLALHQAIRWSLMAQGKRLRPSLLIATARACGLADDGPLLSTAAALEMIHTYSLIHDDLPSMDDDDLRRGRPTCHVRFGEATAILAGDALQTLAFQAIAEDESLEPQVRMRLIAELARAAGTPGGMVAGQAYDLEAAAREVDGAGLERIHLHKTGALIIVAARCGALIADASRQSLEALKAYAAALGLLFQITDDLLDVTASAQDWGKTPGKDERAAKATYPALYGLEAARRMAREVHSEACAALAGLEGETELLRAIAGFILRRRG